MDSEPATNSLPDNGETFDVFVSYAHADDEVPTDAERGWVTTLVGELQKVLRRKLGGAGAKVWMDHRLAANEGVTETLLARIDGSRTLLLVMSPGYQKSSWCQRELANYVARASARGKVQSVFPIEIEPVGRESWHPVLQSLTPIPFWIRNQEEEAAVLAGYPKPKLDEDSPYWKRVNELAHLIAKRLLADPSPVDAARRAAVLVAETTDDLDPLRESVASALRQRDDVVVLPATDYPRGTEADFAAAVRSDLKSAALFVQLLGPHAGKKAPGSARGFVATQAEEALRRGPSLRVMQWRPPDLDLRRVFDAAHRELLSGEHVSCVGFEEFRRTVVHAIDMLADARQQATAAPIKQITPLTAVATSMGGGAPANGNVSGLGLSLYLQATPEDRDTADLIADHLATIGASVQLSPDPKPGQTFLECLNAQEAALRMCDGVILVYGQSPVDAIATAFQFARRVFGVRRPGVWSAVLDLPPAEKQRVPIRDRNLMTIECRQGFELAKLGSFFDRLRANGSGGAQHA